MADKHPLLVEMDAHRKAFQEKAKAALKDEFRKFFDAHPEVATIKWTQYTPYFNDGEACTFSVHTPAFYGPGDHSEDDDAECYLYDGYEYSSSKAPADARQLAGLVKGLGDAMKDTFGDHSEIVATRNGFDVQDYEHD